MLHSFSATAEFLALELIKCCMNNAVVKCGQLSDIWCRSVLLLLQLWLKLCRRVLQDCKCFTSAVLMYGTDKTVVFSSS